MLKSWKNLSYRVPLAIIVSAKHGQFPLQSSEPGVHALHQLVPVLQVDQLEGLFSPNAYDYRVGKVGGALCLFYGQNLKKQMMLKRRNSLVFLLLFFFLCWDFRAKMALKLIVRFSVLSVCCSQRLERFVCCCLFSEGLAFPHCHSCLFVTKPVHSRCNNRISQAEINKVSLSLCYLLPDPSWK